VAACSVSSLDDLIADAVATSRKYWIASILIGAVLMGLEAYQKRCSIVLAVSIALLALHPHLTASPFPGPDCVSWSVRASQYMLAVFVVMLVYRVVEFLLARGRTTRGTSE
jgi:predicted cobalt transporter CbtA